MRVLVTGANGFAGGHLAEALLAHGDVEVFGVSLRGEWGPEWAHLAGQVPLRGGDLCDTPAVEAMLREVRPEQVYHLAGYADVRRSFEEPDAAWASNLTAARSLYDAVVRWGGRPRILYVGSGLVYGDAESPAHACDERCPLRPVSPYATSKAAGDLLSYQYTRSAGLSIIRVRPFNHIGPRQSTQYAVPNFARQIAAIEKGLQPAVVETGDLSTQRDFTDVRDMVGAYLLLIEKGRSGEAYNAGSGVAHSIQSVLDRLVALAQVKVEVRRSADLVRPAETAALRADAGKLRRETGWAPRYSLDQTLADTLEYWRSADARLLRPP